MLNPGGPGESGVQFLQEAFSEFPGTLRARFNLVSFDPRGIGGSAPVVCTSPAGLRRWLAVNPAPVTQAAISTVVAAVKVFDAGCAAHVPRDVLASLSTAVTAHDMDRLRAALGQGKLDYLGFSYGTFLGALYAEAFPDHVGHMVLDGAIDPALPNSVLDLQQANAFELDLHDFFAWCPTNATCKRELPGGAESTYDRIIGHLKSGATLPADLTAALGGTQQVNYAVVLTGVISSLYTTTYWPYLAQGLAQAATGNGSVLAELAYSYAGFNANGTASNLLSASSPSRAWTGPRHPTPRCPRSPASSRGRHRISALRRPGARSVATTGQFPSPARSHRCTCRSRCRSSSSAPPMTRQRRTPGLRRSPGS